MEYDLLKHRNFQADDSTASMRLLYFYSRYRKDREEAKAAASAAGGGRVVRVSGG